MIQAQEEFRDHVSNQETDGRRKWIYPRLPKGGVYYRWRIVVALGLLLILFGLPWLEFQGHPLFLFNVLDRKFIFFGVPFWPQDFYLVALGLLAFMVFIIAFTVAFGRVWCGWACPQTIFMEVVFRTIENWIEGDYKAQKKLDAGPWNSDKIRKKTLKHLVFFLISFAIANTFLAYLIGKDELLAIQTDNPMNHLGGLASLLVFTVVFYLVFAKLREIVCIVICPYGRLQGVLLDKKSIVVAYDYVRGEPRGKLSKKENETPKGDCVDCSLCVQVCPTGIDIRHGTQLECINCTACIDACDQVMDKIHKPKGLIRYASLEGIEQKKKLRFDGRLRAYSAVLLILTAVIGYLLVVRKDVDTTILRASGLTFQKQPDGRISNLYNLEIVNKTFRPVHVTVRVKQPDFALQFVGQPLTTVEPGELTKGSFFLSVPARRIRENKTPLVLEILADGKMVEEVGTNFMGPVE
ncbi:cytochrome c oxidase accessory protein CcoG [Siphonobacter aquaeclarae]|uniref:Cytochrome c oxidase accessory protein FixG n=1 Tax=Siphonobacter aquaeclarae TaxID=563176 RepID=A0A1G9QGP6_9BACT|nr:cytochrome c oxidase accessory protein CcoG [Siphonobacter aquaeclarae]SDM10156.1 cytochrome c oxidase accessory protein FixG [Siphonobacter aquaeclarae]